MRPLLPCALALALVACTPGEVIIQGYARESREDTAPLLSGGQVRIYDRAGEPYGAAATTGDGVVVDTGWFEVAAPAGQVIHALVSRDEDIPPTSLPGVSGLQNRFTVEEGAIWGFRASELAEWEQDFAGCPGVGEGGAILGEVRLYLPTDDALPLVTTATAEAALQDPASGEGEPVAACYLDAEGTWSAELDRTGVLGRFAIFGLEQGLYDLAVSYEPIQGTLVEASTEVFVPDGGVVPRFPAYVELY